MNHPITATLARSGRWLTLYEITRQTAEEFPGGEDHAVSALRNHMRNGDIRSRLVDAGDEAYEYGLTSWPAANDEPLAEADPMELAGAHVRLTTALDWSTTSGFGTFP